MKKITAIVSIALAILLTFIFTVNYMIFSMRVTSLDANTSTVKVFGVTHLYKN